MSGSSFRVAKRNREFVATPSPSEGGEENDISSRNFVGVGKQPSDRLQRWQRARVPGDLTKAGAGTWRDIAGPKRAGVPDDLQFSRAREALE